MDSSLPKKKYRRTKEVVKHANPLFDKWLQEWENDAAALGSNMRFNYRRARNSLKLYPIPVYRGRECKVLAHFGDKICQMLDRKLEKYIDENGPIVWEEIHQVMGPPVSKQKPRKRTSKKALPSSERPETDCDDLADVSVSSSGKGKGRPYVPSFRSGGYALLVTLYKSTNSDIGFMKKTELMEAAQPLCNASFTHATDGSHYTAWSSMSTLVKKNLVIREGNPSRYSLTTSGKALAIKLIGGGNADSEITSNILADTADSDDEIELLSSPAKNGIRSGSSVSSESSYGKCESSDVPKRKVNQRKRKNSSGDLGKTVPSSNGDYTFVFSYVTSLELETPLKDRAVVCVEDDGFLGFLIKCHLSDLRNSGLSYRIDDNRTAPVGFTYAYLSNECAPDQSPGLLSPRQKLPPTSKKPVPEGVGSEVVGKSLFSEVKKKSRGDKPSNPTVSLLEDIIPKHNSVNFIKPVSPVKRFCVEPPVSSIPQFSLLPDMYEIVLCIDNAEATGGFQGTSKFNVKEIFVKEMDKHKVKYDIRKLHVGDFLWIARERSGSEPRELVLPYIVERKRMDDLAKSIKDGRFKEQKFRLKQSGLSKPIYLVEEYGSQNMSLPEATCLQAVTNTQVVDGFTVKVTKDQIESAAYLTIMTRCLQSRYRGRTLSSAGLDQLSNREDANKVETALIPFKDFNVSSMKNHQLTVKEMFAKHLLQLNGLSVDKARAIVDKFETPAALLAAYESLQNPAESENLLASLKCGKTGRNFGPSLSVQVARLYTNLTLQ